MDQASRQSSDKQKLGINYSSGIVIPLQGPISTEWSHKYTPGVPHFACVIIHFPFLEHRRQEEKSLWRLNVLHSNSGARAYQL